MKTYFMNRWVKALALMVLLLTNISLEAQSFYKPNLSNKWLDKDTSVAGYDGPYIFYEGNKATVYDITMEKGIAKVRKQTFDKGVAGKSFSSQVDASDAIHFKIKDQITNASAEYPMPEKLIAISDIEGEFAAFKEFLINNGVMDKHYKWTFGKGHLVTVGDFFDRGLLVTQTLWLIYHLENEAEKAGGKVHFVIGNHDIMNMNEDFRYTRKKYFEDAILMGVPYLDFYKPNTELGRWLGSKNIIEKIGDYVFLHAGISKQVSDLGLSVQQMDDAMRPYYFREKEARKMIKDNPVIETLYHYGTSLYWHRGQGTVKETAADTQAYLAKLGAKKMVIGHSLHDGVTYLLDKTVIDLDVEHADGITEGLLIEGGKEYVVDKAGKRSEIRENVGRTK
jgi:metallophosphoesterase